MSKTRYKIEGDQVINVKGLGRITNEVLTDSMAEKLLTFSQFKNIIILKEDPKIMDLKNDNFVNEISVPKKKKKKNKLTKNVDKEQDNKSNL